MYLVNCEVIESCYMGDDIVYERNHIVDCDSYELACDRVINHYVKDNDPYGRSYWVNINYCNEVL